MGASDISKNILEGEFTEQYSHNFLAEFKEIEDINYYIHDEVSLLDRATLTFS